MFAKTGRRFFCAFTVNLTRSFAGEVQVWLFFVSDDLKLVSETEHLGEFIVSA